MILTWIRSCVSLSALWITLLMTGSADSIAPTISVNPCPVCAGDVVYIEVSGMPDVGTWTITIDYSDGTSDPPTTFTDAGAGSTRSNAPTGAAGGSMMVTVEMDGATASVTKQVRSCP